MRNQLFCVVVGGLSVLLLLSSLFPVDASTLTIDAQQQFNFAEQLFQQKHYLRAAEEYQRFAFFFPEDPRRRESHFKAGQAFFNSGRYDSAIIEFKIITAEDIFDQFGVEAYFQLSECYLQQRTPGQALMTLYNLTALSQEDVVRDLAFYRMGWIRLGQMDWNGARQSFENISTAGQRKYRIPDVLSVLQQKDHIPLKSPALAGTLSVIPGGGQLYCGRYEDALIAFVVNVGLFWGAYESFDHDLYALGGLLSFVGVGFYMGNIFGAVTDAHKYNQNKKMRFVDQLKESLIITLGKTAASSPDGLQVGVRFSF
jgi:tetratricopeptide (TPR) repeat protein